jgi:hypothetical protein
MLLINFLEMGVVAGRGRKLACRQHACHDPAMVLRSSFQKGVFVAWQGNDRGTAEERHGVYE